MQGGSWGHGPELSMEISCRLRKNCFHPSEEQVFMIILLLSAGAAAGVQSPESSAPCSQTNTVITAGLIRLKTVVFMRNKMCSDCVPGGEGDTVQACDVISSQTRRPTDGNRTDRMD